jgi:hypothetical protein
VANSSSSNWLNNHMVSAVSVEPASLRDIMVQLSHELRALDERLRAVEHVAELLLAGGNSATPSAIRGFQMIDPLGQTLVALANFAEAVAADIPENWRVDVNNAADNVMITALASRLRAPTQMTMKDILPKAEDYELFD